jgi:hypothetical protein
MNARAYWSVFAAVLVATACQPNEAARVTVNYKQIANFPDYRLASDASDSHGTDGMFILYKVTQINNAGSQAAAFTFNRNNVSTVTPDKTSNETVTDADILLGGLSLSTLAVPAGQTKNVGKCFIKEAQANDPHTLVLAHVGILYAGTSSQPVSSHDLAPNGSIAAVGNALPNILQSLCSAG